MAQEKYYFSESDSPIKDFAPEIIQSIIDTYKEGVLIGQIRKDFNFQSTSSFFKDLPFSLTDEKCSLCASAVYEKHKKVGSGKKYNVYKICANCKHDFSDSCSCATCLEILAAEKKKRETEFKNAWKKHLEINYSCSYQLEELTLYDEINLAIISSNIDQDSSKEYLSFLHTPSNNFNCYFQSIFKKAHQFPDSIQSCAKPLINKEIIIPSIHCTSNISTSTNDDFQINMEKLDEYHWELNVFNEDVKLTPSIFLEYFFNERTFTFYEKKLLWWDVYKVFLADYVEQQTKDTLMNNIDDYTIETITDLLIEDFSLAKAYFLIYCTAKNTIFFENKYKADQQRVNAFFLNNITKLFNKHKKNKTARGFNLPYSIQLSYFHQFIVHNILKLEKNNYFYLASDKLFPIDILDTLIKKYSLLK